LGYSRRFLVKRLSNPEKKCKSKRWCKNGCACSQYFLRGIWRTYIEQNGGYVEKWQSCNDPIYTKLDGKKMFRFSFYSHFVELYYVVAIYTTVT
jgi:hypothetical protein